MANHTQAARYALRRAGPRRPSYALLTDPPFHNCLTSMLVRELGQSRAELEWSATFEADGLPAEEARELLEAALAANCVALKQFMEAGWE